MRNILFITQLLIGRKNINFTVLKSLVIRFAFIPVAKMSIKERFVLLLQYMRITLLIPFRLKKTNKTSAILNGGEGSLQKDRQIYIDKYSGERDSLFIGVFPKKMFYSKLSPSVLLKVLKLVSGFGFVLCCNVFNSGKTGNAKKYLYLYFYLLQIILLDKKNSKVFCLQIWMPESYAASLILSELGYNVTMVTSSSPIHCNNRYIWAPKVGLAYASRFQLEEIQIFRERKHFVVKSVELWGPENVVDFENIKAVENPKYDIGIYSGGSWARDHLNRRVLDGDKVTSSSQNNYYHVFELILDAVIELKEEFNIKVVIFPHPHERELFKNGVIPPYTRIADINDVKIDFGSGNSINQFFNVKIGVSTVSTSIFDRIHLGLKGYVFSGKNFKGFMIKPDYLGSFQHICFDDKNELKQKIILDLNLEKQKI